ncbi:MAG: SDR family NAD(P)-dependent oxidoreductase [Thermanaerothrix sp.]|nr:SDR family NAD(P)-dependent oxidoreductase [Thermanaerothrix sp.]
MKVLVTGGAGFIGSHLVDRLAQQADYEIVIFDNLLRGRLENIAHHRHNPRISFVHGDVRRYGDVLDAMRGCQIVYHLAAQTRVMSSLAQVDACFETNVIGTFNVLKAAHNLEISKVIFTSSGEVYGEPRHLPVDENHPLRSKNPYGASKVAAEVYCQVFKEVYSLPVIILRLSHVYGPRDVERVIPVWIRNALDGKDLIVFGGEQIIDFIWVETVVEALVRSASLPTHTDPINIGHGKGVPILALAKRILELTNSPSQLVLKPPRAAEVVRYEPRVERMHTLLGLHPAEEALEHLPKLISTWREIL